MHAIRRWAVAVGLLGTTLTACQLPAHDRDVARALPHLLSGVFRTAAATPAGRPATSTDRATAGAAPAAAPVAPIPEVPPALASPAQVATALTSAEATIHEPQPAPGPLRDAARAEQQAYAAVAAHPDWRDAVVARVPAELHDVVAANTTAAVDLRTLDRSSDDLPRWQVSDPPAAADLVRWYHEAEQQSGVPWAYLAAINLVETRMGRIHADSIAGAQGPMQFMPDTWQQYGEGGDVHDPHAAILAAGRFLSTAGGPADMAGALHQYNPSQLYVEAVTAYAQRMLADPRAFDAYYQWQADASTTAGPVILPTGYSR